MIPKNGVCNLVYTVNGMDGVNLAFQGVCSVTYVDSLHALFMMTLQV